MADGSVLPFREWMPASAPSSILIAFHGMNDSRNAWEYPAPYFVAAGMAVIAPDLRGFGATKSRGHWPGTNQLVSDTQAMIRLVRQRFPHTKVFLIGESMGAALLMVSATQEKPLEADGLILIAPAVWGRSKMNFWMRAGLWVADHTMPGLMLYGGGLVKVTASDNPQALLRLSTDPLTIHGTRVDAIKGLVDLMDQALTAASQLKVPALILYGGHDELVPARATATIWRSLPREGVRVFYPAGYHLLLRDQERLLPINDIISWIGHPDKQIPSGADTAVQAWLAHQPTSN